MSYLLSEPDAVLVIGGNASERETPAATLRDAVPTVVAVDSVAAASAALTKRDDVSCVVLLDGGSLEEALETVRDADYGGRLPVVTYVDPDTEVAAAAATREGCRYLPRSAGEGTFRTAVTDALATYGRRRWEAADSDILELLFETADMTLFAKDDRGRYLKTNQSVAEPDHSDVIGQTDREVFGGLNPRMAQAAYRDDLAVVETGEPIENKREKFGNEHWSEVTKVPWRADGETLGLVGIAQHVTSEVKLKQKLAEQNRRFDQFASYVSHDLRTPLQIAVGALDRARAGDEEALDKLENAHDRIADLRRLADEDVQVESPEVLEAADTTVESTRLGALVEKTWRIMSPSDATLEMDVPERTVVVSACPVVVPIDATESESLGLSTRTDVGAVAVSGDATFDDGTGRWRIMGGGKDIWGDVNEFHFVAAKASGPIRIQAKVESLEEHHEYSKAGVMVRDSLDKEAAFMHTGTTIEHGSEVIQRSIPGQPAASEQLEEPPDVYPWYRLDRVGGTVTASLSADGKQFHPVDQRSVTLTDPVFVGLAVCSHQSGKLSEATFSNVNVVELDVE